MNLKTRVSLYWVFWSVIILSGPLTVILNTSSFDSLKDPVILLNFIQRITGLLAFTLISMQIVLGSLMNNWIQIVGAKAYKFHITQGLFTYGLMLIHPLMEISIVYELSGNLTKALSVVVPSLSTQREMYMTYGRFALVLATITVGAAYFRTKPLFRRHWLKFHILNYFIFYAIYLHMRLGADITTPPFVWISWLALISVTGSAIKRFMFPLVAKIKLAKPSEVGSQKA